MHLTNKSHAGYDSDYKCHYRILPARKYSGEIKNRKCIVESEAQLRLGITDNAYIILIYFSITVDITYLASPGFAP